ncbi:hydantoinase/oxoprolinase family protein [Nocardia jiangxiensis]|uniref:Hydantoinase/oxoprolinase family protein n=1 Tax=Nocardia jiangxiensis TaxID=282685 RepID=A0ABW6S6T2_9NOCA
MAELVGVDVGGTFTDCVAFGDDDSVVRAKVLTTPEDPSIGFLNGITELARLRGMRPRDYGARITRIVHGTTVATNAALTGNGARTALLTTAGFRDALQMRRGVKENQYDNRYAAPRPLVPRRLRIGIAERTTSTGEILVRPDRDEIRRAVAELRAQGVEAIAICFMHSYANPANERMVADIAAEEMPEIYVTASADLLPEVRFYERVATTVYNAYVGPIVANYLGALTERLSEVSFDGRLLIMQSHGGVVTPETAVVRAAGALLSGPAAGPITGAAYGTRPDAGRAITADMGGTSFDVAVVRDRKPVIVRDAEFDRHVVALPATDIHAIGAGGGSIAWIDDGGLLRMGPQSAGSRPGPACYGFGGIEPTVSDSNLVLGYLDPDNFAGGDLSLRVDLAEQAIKSVVADPLGLGVAEAAAGMHRVVNVNMAMGVRAVSVNRGVDPREVPLVVGGGCGPIHAARIAEELGIRMVVIPQASGLFCATGMLLSDFRHDFVHTFLSSLSDVDQAELAGLLHSLRESGTAALESDGVAEDDHSYEFSLDMRYRGQHREIEVPCTIAEVASDLSALRGRFDRLHEALYAHRVPEAVTEIVNVRARALGLTRKLPLPGEVVGERDASTARVGGRPAYLTETAAYADLPVYDGERLRAGHIVPGPALIDEPTTTLLVPPTFDLSCAANGSKVLTHHALREGATR